MCGYRKREDGTKMFSPPGDCCFFSLSTSRFFPFWFWKRDFFLVVFASCVVRRRRHSALGEETSKISPKKSHPQTQQKEGKSTHFVVLSVVSRSPGKLFKRTLTYCGKCTHGYVKREREKKNQAHFLLRLTRVLAITRGEKVREEERNSQNKLHQPKKSSSSSSSKGKEGKNLCRPLSSSA